MNENYNKYKIICSKHENPKFPTRIFEVCYKYVLIDLKLLSSSQKEGFDCYAIYQYSGILQCWIKNSMVEDVLDNIIEREDGGKVFYIVGEN